MNVVKQAMTTFALGLQSRGHDSRQQGLSKQAQNVMAPLVNGPSGRIEGEGSPGGAQGFCRRCLG